MKPRDIIPVAALAALCAAMWFVPAAHPLADDGGEPVRARVVAVDDSALAYTGLIEYGTQNQRAQGFLKANRDTQAGIYKEDIIKAIKEAVKG